MNYRHAFHAGNFADVLKHAVLALIIEHLKLKPAPFRVIDTHAGAGRYDLGSSAAQRTGEWQNGIGRILGPSAPALPADTEALLLPYLSTVRALNPDGGLAHYPGSPLLALKLMRDADRLIGNELHPEDQLTLAKAIGRDPRAKTLSIDGWQALKALLPPKERRGVVLIDPPFEEAGEFGRMIEGLREAHRRFETGTVLLWLPVKDAAEVKMFYEAARNSGGRKMLRAELNVGQTSVDGRLSASALIITNPPFRLDAKLDVLLPFLADRLRQGDGADHCLEWLAGHPEA